MPRPLRHGTVYRYKQGCRCAECTAAKTADMREYVSNVRARDGVSPTQKIRPAKPTRSCVECGNQTRSRNSVPRCKPCSLRFRRMVSISPADRAFIYERDAWICQFCLEPVEPGLPSSSPWQATLDHIVPRAKGGLDQPENLRLLHRYCNGVRSDSDSLTLSEMTA